MIHVNPRGVVLKPEAYALDVETSGLDPHKDILHAIAISNGKDDIVYDINTCDVADVKRLFTQAPEGVRWVAHNMKFDIKFIYAYTGMWLEDIWCTEVMSRILDNGMIREKGYHSLLSCLDRFLNIKDLTTEKKQDLRDQFIGRPRGKALSEELIEYAAHDVKHLLVLMNKQKAVLSNAGLVNLSKLENKVLPVLARIEMRGALLDVPTLSEMSDVWEAEVEEMKPQLNGKLLEVLQGIDLTPSKDKRRKSANVNAVRVYKSKLSTKAIQEDLFGPPATVSEEINHASEGQVINIIDAMGLPIPTTRDKKAEARREAIRRGLIAKGESVKHLSKKPIYKNSISRDSIEEYLNEHLDSPLKDYFTMLLDFREVNKLASTYGKSLIEKTIDGRIHTEYTQVWTHNLRLSSRGPNLQNIPGALHKVFIAPKGYKLITSDMSNAEGRIAASFSGEEFLIEGYNNDTDMHSVLASISFSIICGEPVTISNTDELLQIGDKSFKKSELREQHKRVLFGKFYKAGPGRVRSILAPYINLVRDTAKERMAMAKEISRTFDEQLSRLTEYLNKKVQEANRSGKVRGSMGAYRLFAYPKDAYADAANFPISQTNAVAMKIALVNIDKYIRENNIDGGLILTVHDEVVVECVSEKAEEVAEEIKKNMEESLAYFLQGVTSKASVKILDHWEK